MGVLTFRIRNRIKGSAGNKNELHHLLDGEYSLVCFFILLGREGKILAAICHSTFACIDILAEN